MRAKKMRLRKTNYPEGPAWARSEPAPRCLETVPAARKTLGHHSLSLSQAGINDVHELRIFNYFISSSPSSSSCPLAIYLRSSLEPPPPAPAPASPRSVAAAIDRWPVRITCTSFPYLARSHEVRGKCHRRVQSALLGVSWSSKIYNKYMTV